MHFRENLSAWTSAGFKLLKCLEDFELPKDAAFHHDEVIKHGSHKQQAPAHHLDPLEDNFDCGHYDDAHKKRFISMKPL